MTEQKAILFDIQRNSYVDGPGIRTTVFFKGCNLRCAWCHNPESQSSLPQMMREATKITECGKEYALEEALNTVCKDKRFYESSGGGVTFSGGECMLQIDFLENILRECKRNGIHTAVDTAGHVPFERFERILPYTDLFLYDVKCYDSAKHKKYTGVGNELILENLAKLLQTKKSVWIRIPIIPTVNDSAEEMTAIRKMLDLYGLPEKVELLPYHAMGEHKYTAIGRTCHIFSPPSAEKIEELKKIFS